MHLPYIRRDAFRIYNAWRLCCEWECMQILAHCEKEIVNKHEQLSDSVEAKPEKLRPSLTFFSGLFFTAGITFIISFVKSTIHIWMSSCNICPQNFPCHSKMMMCIRYLLVVKVACIFYNRLPGGSIELVPSHVTLVLLKEDAMH